ncbi:putative siroheme synthase [Magnetofaba australis IT-1]|uniref:precorrin-2 dehydrogenase n=1 Tax=Magnetofaba australis IT-1 TaxID=1434232 RepID=A0A1Y2K6Z9_9PROT|nr:putative siroheme synthase [Magnetofaba australis IT-1]
MTLLALELEGELLALAEEGALAWRREPFTPEMLDDVWFVLCADDNPELHMRLSRVCAQRRIFLNVVDRKTHCSAIWPALVDRHPVVAALTTGGASPALSSWLRRRLQQAIPEGVDALAQWLSAWRARVAKQRSTFALRARFWREAFEQDKIPELYLEGRIQEADALLKQRLEGSEDGRKPT